LTVSASIAASYAPLQTGIQIPVTVRRSSGQITLGTYAYSRLFWSTNNTWDSADKPLWESNNTKPDFPVSTLNSAGSATVNATINIPTSTPGTYYIIAFVDPPTSSYPAGFHQESDESNNKSAYTVVIAQSSNQPPVLSNGRFEPSSIIVNTTAVTFYVTCKDAEGRAPSKAVLQGRLSGASTWQNLGTMSALSADYRSGAIFSLRLNSLASVGTWQMRAVFNDGDHSTDTNYEFAGPVVENIPTANPYIMSTTPANQGIISELQPDCIVQFSEKMNRATFTSANVIMTGSKSGAHSSNLSFTWQENDTRLLIRSSRPFQNGESIELRISRNVQSTAGKGLLQDFMLRFSTTAQIATTQMQVNQVLVEADHFDAQPNGTIRATGNVRFNKLLFLGDTQGSVEISSDKSKIIGSGVLNFSTIITMVPLWDGGFEVVTSTGFVRPTGIINRLLETVSGFTIERDGYDLSFNLVEKSLTLKPKLNFDVRGVRIITSGHLIMRHDGAVTGALDNFNLKLAGIDFSCQSVQFSDGTLSVANARLNLKAAKLGSGMAEVGGLNITPQKISFKSGKAELNIELDQFKIYGMVAIIEQNGQYRMNGEGKIVIAGLFNNVDDKLGLKVTYDIWESGLNSLKVAINGKIPIGNTGFFLTSVGGGIDGLQTDSKSFTMSADFVGGIDLPVIGYVIDGDDGDALNNSPNSDRLGASMTITWGADTQFDMVGVVNLIKYVKARGRLHYEHRLKLFNGTLEVSAEAALLGVGGNVEVNIWKAEEKSNFSATGKLKGYLKKGAVNIPLLGFDVPIPLWEITIGNVESTIGPFENGNVYGLHCKFEATPLIKAALPKYAEKHWLVDGFGHFYLDQYWQVKWAYEADAIAKTMIRPPNVKGMDARKSPQLAGLPAYIEQMTGFLQYARTRQSSSTFTDDLPVLIEDRTYGLFILASRQAGVELELVDPKGKTYTPANLPADSTITYSSDGNAQVYDIARPISGIWKARVLNISSNEGYALQVYGGRPLPKFSFSAITPDATGAFRISWSVQNADDRTYLHLFADSDDHDLNGRYLTSVRLDTAQSYTWHPDNLPSADYYIYGILQHESYNTSQYSTVVHLTDNQPPDPPTALYGAPAQDGFNLNFLPSPSPDVAGYRLYLGTQPGHYDSIIYLDQQTFFKVHTSDLLPRYWTVSALDHSGNESILSAPALGLASATADSVAPLPPSAVHLNKLDESSLEISWQPVPDSDIRGYAVHYGTSSKAYLYSRYVTGQTRIQINNLTPGFTYYLAVTSFDHALNWSTPSTENCITMVSDNDQDHDGLPDQWEMIFFESLEKASSGSEDADVDGLSNQLELLYHLNPIHQDSDGDKVMDGLDAHPAQNNDLDGDGIPDDWELFHDISEAAVDTDRDGLTNLQEFHAGTDPHNSDTDLDGMEDGYEQTNDYNPLVSDATACSVTGSINYGSQERPLGHVGLNAIGANRFFFSDEAGDYTATGLALGSSYTFSPIPPAASSADATAITFYDAALCAQAAFGLRSLNIAETKTADADANGVLSFFDAALIAQAAIGFERRKESNVLDWFFEPQLRTFMPLDRDEERQNFSAFLIGDVNGDWGKNTVSTSRKMIEPEQWSKISLQPDSTICVELLNTEETVHAVQIRIGFDPEVLTYLNTTRGSLTHAFNLLDRQAKDEILAGAYVSQPALGLGSNLKLWFKIRPNHPSQTDLHIRNYQINEKTIGSAILSTKLQPSEQIPAAFQVSHNYPNPFNSGTTININLPEAGRLSVKLYNLQGKLVQVLAQESQMAAGHHHLIWNGTSLSGQPASSGIYFCTVQFGDQRRTVKFTLIK